MGKDKNELILWGFRLSGTNQYLRREYYSIGPISDMRICLTPQSRGGVLGSLKQFFPVCNPRTVIFNDENGKEQKREASWKDFDLVSFTLNEVDSESLKFKDAPKIIKKFHKKLKEREKGL